MSRIKQTTNVIKANLLVIEHFKAMGGIRVFFVPCHESMIGSYQQVIIL
jgi:hypothetical protein